MASSLSLEDIDGEFLQSFDVWLNSKAVFNNEKMLNYFSDERNTQPITDFFRQLFLRSSNTLTRDTIIVVSYIMMEPFDDICLIFFETYMRFHNHEYFSKRDYAILKLFLEDRWITTDYNAVSVYTKILDEVIQECDDKKIYLSTLGSTSTKRGPKKNHVRLEMIVSLVKKKIQEGLTKKQAYSIVAKDLNVSSDTVRRYCERAANKSSD
jgi:hypothetical protein